MNICNTIMTSQMHVHIPRMNRMSLVWIPLTPFYFIFTYGNIFYVRPHYQEHNHGVKQWLPVQCLRLN